MEKPFGSPGARFGAYMIDSMFLFAIEIGGGVLGGFVASMLVQPGATKKVAEDAFATGMVMGIYFWLFVAAFLNFVVLQGLTGASVGKMATGLRVVNQDGSPIGIAKAFARSFCHLISAIPLYLGYLAIFSNDERRCWHDSICGTVVIRKDARYPAVAALPESVTEQGSFPRAA